MVRKSSGTARRSSGTSSEKPIKGPSGKSPMSIRPIENGYIISREQPQPKNGPWVPAKEEFVKTLPKGLK